MVYIRSAPSAHRIAGTWKLLTLSLVLAGDIPQNSELTSDYPSGSGLLYCKGVVKTRSVFAKV